METRSRTWAGWISFAGVMLFVVGAINVFEGILALISDESVVATPDRFVLVDLTGWGSTLTVTGLMLVAVAVGLSARLGWARFVAIVLVGTHAAAQVLSLRAYPVWSLLMIALDTVVLYALTARWSDRPDDDGDAVPRAPGDQLHGRLPHEVVRYGPRLT
jgi:lysylphosphatidylglycerol synthetase-like protein (DUF2156 family)